MDSPWMKLVKKLKKKHPSWMLKDVLIEAKKLYRK